MLLRELRRKLALRALLLLRELALRTLLLLRELAWALYLRFFYYNDEALKGIYIEGKH